MYNRGDPIGLVLMTNYGHRRQTPSDDEREDEGEGEGDDEDESDDEDSDESSSTQPSSGDSDDDRPPRRSSSFEEKPFGNPSFVVVSVSRPRIIAESTKSEKKGSYHAKMLQMKYFIAPHDKERTPRARTGEGFLSSGLFSGNIS